LGYGVKLSDNLALKKLNMKYFASVMLFKDYKLMAKLAQAMNLESDYNIFIVKANSTKKKIAEAFFNNDDPAKLNFKSQSAYSLAFYYDIIEDQYKQNAFNNLLDLIDEEKSFTTGLFCTTKLFNILNDYGYDNIVYDFIFDANKFESFFYQIDDSAYGVDNIYSFSLARCSIIEFFLNSIFGFCYKDDIVIFRLKFIEVEDFKMASLKRYNKKGMIYAYYNLEGLDLNINIILPPGLNGLLYLPLSLKEKEKIEQISLHPYNQSKAENLNPGKNNFILPNFLK